MLMNSGGAGVRGVRGGEGLQVEWAGLPGDWSPPASSIIHKIVFRLAPSLTRLHSKFEQT